ncbi:hypothetical protein [Shivajiella indica]|uniref:Lipocalin-like domain-containing protein n=1 Tax=Shivajiella indica TaxID=872115 RepID=A0ABW5BFW4_9BACT
MKKIVLLFSFLFLLSSCMDQETMTFESGEFPLGSWSNLEYNETGFSMERTNALKENTYGFIFQENGKLINRSNSGFCGTPPIVTQDFSGKWKVDGEVLKVEMDFWGGKIIQEWRILSHSARSVRVEVIKNEYKFDS